MAASRKSLAVAFNFLSLFFCFFCLEARSAPIHVDAYSKFWKRFKIYEESLEKESKKEYLKSISAIEDEHEKIKKNSIIKNIETLKEVEKEYLKQIETFPNAPTKPYVLMNLSNIYMDLSYLLKEQDKKDETYIKKSLATLTDIQKNYPEFEFIDQTLYLLAICNQSLDDNEKSLHIWKVLAQKNIPSIYGVHSFVAIGDNFFSKDLPKEAFEAFEKGYFLLNKINLEDKDTELIKLEYRLLWAAHRAALFDKIMLYGKSLLKPNRFVLTVNELSKIQQDAIELIGDSLFDADNIKNVHDFLSEKEIKVHLPAICLHVIKRFFDAKEYDHVISTANNLLKEASLSLEHPFIYQYLALSYQEKGLEDKKIQIFEAMSFLLPQDSLYHTKYKDSGHLLKKADEIIFQNLKYLAFWKYQKAFNAHQANLYLMAADYFKQLIQYDPNNSDLEKWMFYQASSYYYSSEFEKAISIYESIKKLNHVSEQMLQSSAYQIVLCYELYYKKIMASKEIKNEEIKNQIIDKFINSISFYSNKYEKSERSAELLLVGASAFRDYGLYDKAEDLWQKVLLSKTTPFQRSQAIRGLVFVAVQTANPEDVMNISKQYLKLESNNSVDKDLKDELYLILSSATKKESARLKEAGYPFEAGLLMVQTAKDFPQIQDAALVYRDGAYLLAISAHWDDAHDASLLFFKKDLFHIKSASIKITEEMHYLKAKSEEYLLDFSSAAISYYHLAKNYPSFSKRFICFMKSKDLAEASSDYKIAAEAAFSLAILEKNHEKKLNFFDESIKFFTLAKEKEKSLIVLEAKKKELSSNYEKIHLQLEIALLHFAFDEKDASLTMLKELRQKIAAQNDNLNKEDYLYLSSEINLEMARILYKSLPEMNKELTFQSIKSCLEENIKKGSENFIAESRWILARSYESYGIDLLNEMRIKNNVSFGDKNKLEKIAKNYIEAAKKLDADNMIDQAKLSKIGSSKKHLLKSNMKVAKNLGEFNFNQNFPYQKPLNYSFNLPAWSLK